MKTTSTAPDLRCVCAYAYANAKEAIANIPSQHPDVVLMDIHLPGGENDVVCTARLKELLPKTQFIILTVYKDHDLVFQALKADACGCLLMRSSQRDILQAIADVQGGGAPRTNEIARMLVETFQPPPSQSSQILSVRETEILTLVAKGHTNKEIAAQMNLSFHTVGNHLRHIYEKLQVRSRTEAAMKCRAPQLEPCVAAHKETDNLFNKKAGDLRRNAGLGQDKTCPAVSHAASCRG
jgi:DNA-binding NarL/FixJ family response regulator